jgi:hypothetical protein
VQAQYATNVSKTQKLGGNSSGDKPAQRATAKQLAIVIASGESGLLSPAARAPKGEQYYLPKAAQT